MFSHIMIGTNDIERSKAFYNKVLAVLGVGEPGENTNATGQKRLFYRHAGNTFSISEPIDGQPACVSNGATIGFKCETPEQLKAFHDTAIAAGGTAIEDEPGQRGHGLWLCYFRDPDGNKICGLHRPAA